MAQPRLQRRSRTGRVVGTGLCGSWQPGCARPRSLITPDLGNCRGAVALRCAHARRPALSGAELDELVKRRAKRAVAPSAAHGTIGPWAIISACAHELVPITVGAWQIAVACVSGRLGAAEHTYSERKSHAKKELSAHCETLQCPLLGSPNLTLTLNAQTPSSILLRKLERGEPYPLFRNCRAMPWAHPFPPGTLPSGRRLHS